MSATLRLDGDVIAVGIEGNTAVVGVEFHGQKIVEAGAIADIHRSTRSAVVSQYNIFPMVQIYATTQGRDLGAVAADVQKIVDEMASEA